MSRSLLALLIISLAVLIAACGVKPRRITVKKYPDAFVGEGVSAKGLDEAIERDQATTNALVNIAQQVEVEVRSLAESYLRGTTSSSGDASAALSDQDFTRVTKTLTQAFLRGARPEEYEYRRDGSIMAVVVMPKEDFYQQMKTKIPDQIKREILRVQIQHEDAQKKLDAEINKRIEDLPK